jgi:hypothetical protein
LHTQAAVGPESASVTVQVWCTPHVVVTNCAQPLDCVSHVCTAPEAQLLSPSLQAFVQAALSLVASVPASMMPPELLSLAASDVATAIPLPPLPEPGPLPLMFDDPLLEPLLEDPLLEDPLLGPSPWPSVGTGRSGREQATAKSDDAARKIETRFIA